MKRTDADFETKTSTVVSICRSANANGKCQSGFLDDEQLSGSLHNVISPNERDDSAVGGGAIAWRTGDSRPLATQRVIGMKHEWCSIRALLGRQFMPHVPDARSELISLRADHRLIVETCNALPTGAHIHGLFLLALNRIEDRIGTLEKKLRIVDRSSQFDAAA